MDLHGGSPSSSREAAANRGRPRHRVSDVLHLVSPAARPTRKLHPEHDLPCLVALSCCSGRVQSIYLLRLAGGRRQRARGASGNVQ